MITKRKFPWFGKRLWEDIFFVHWRVPPDSLKPYVPKPFELDLFDGAAWISAVCFQAKKNRVRHIPLDLMRPGYQLNVRTYVDVAEKQEKGVYFFDLFLNKKAATIGAKAVFQLPFTYAEISYETDGNEYGFTVVKENSLTFHGRFQKGHQADHSALAAFLTERYCIWNVKGDKIIKIPIIHSTWNIQRAEAITIDQQVHPLLFGKTPDAIHYADRKMAYLYPYETIIHLDVQ